ncbi:MAG: Rne/Rng family ribonuclease, partial [Proteobacteria bacterium]|nr:Rne/Rng family ribonuclease [Pseudomonadota bacterium]
MTQSLLIDHVPGETRVALVEDGDLVEIKIERDGFKSHVGNIYLGRIEAVETALNAAFVTLPDGPPGYLSVKDAAALSPDATGTSRRIDRLVHEGQNIL